MAPSGDTIALVHSGMDSSNKTLLKSEALYKVYVHTCNFFFHFKILPCLVCHGLFISLLFIASFSVLF
jgi:hypothetical protein